MADSGIKHLIVLKFQDVLTKACQTDIAEDDTTRVDAVNLRVAELTGNERLLLIIRHMDPLSGVKGGDTSRNNLSSMLSSLFRDWPAGTIGGREFKVSGVNIELRGTIEREDTEEADRIVQLVMGRAEKAIRDHAMEFGQLKDTFGNECQMIRIAEGTPYDSGDSGSSTSRYFLRCGALIYTAQPTA